MNLTRLFALSLWFIALGVGLVAQEDTGEIENTFTGVEGNWEVVFKGSDGAARAQISIWPTKHLDGIKSDWQVSCQYFGGPSDGNAHMKVEAVSGSSVTLKRYDWYYHQHEVDYNLFTLSLESPDLLKGRWESNEGKDGEVVATRVYPKITRVEFFPIRPNRATWMRYDSPKHHVSNLPGEMPQAEYVYRKSGWGTGNNARGTRPLILMNLYGENLWGIWRTRIEENQENFETFLPGAYVDAYSRVNENGGRKSTVHIWGEPKPGRYTYNANGTAFQFDFVVHGYPPPPLTDLLMVDRDGRGIETLREGEVFAIEARFAEPNEVQPMVVAQTSFNGRDTNINLNPQADRKIFRTSFFQMLDSAARTPDVTGSIPPETAAVIAQHFSGNWIVRNMTTDDRSYLGGQVTLDQSGKSGVLVQNEVDRAGRYVMLEAAVETPVDGATLPSAITALFREDVAAPPITDGEVYPFYRYHESGESFEFGLMELERAVPVEWSDASLNANTLEFRFSHTQKTWLEGEWRAEKAIASHGANGVSWWTRGIPRIRQIEVVDEYGADDLYLPYTREATPTSDGSITRRLLVLGENLPAIQGSMENQGTSPRGNDPLLHYGAFAVDEQTRELLLKRIYDANQRSRPTDEDQLVVYAKMESGVKSGRKELTFGSAIGYWPLRFNDDNADLRFTRDRTFERDDKASLFHPGETAFLTVDMDFAQHLPDSKKVELAIFAQPEDEAAPRLLGKVSAERMEEELKPTFRSEGLALTETTEDDAEITTEGGVTTVPVKAGWRLTAVPASGDLMLTPATILLAEPDEELGQLWLEILKKVSRCPDVQGDIEDPKRFAMERGEGFSRGIYVSRIFTTIGSFVDGVAGNGGIDDTNNDLTLRNGSHAAAILIRDEYVRQMTIILPRYEAEANDPRAVEAFWDKARQNRGAANDGFWKYNKVRGLRFPGGIPLAEVLDLEYLAEHRLGGVTETEATSWAITAVTSALKQRVEDMSTAVIRAQRAGNCDLDEIMVFAGYRAPHVVQAITSKLLIKQNGRWVPDDQAIRFVRGLYVAGRAIRALEAYSDIDNSYNAMAVAVATAGATAGLNLAGHATAAAYTSLAGNVIDMTVVGGLGVRDYVKGEKDFDTAKGVAPVMGDEAVRHAESMRKGEFGTAFGVLFPLRGAVSELQGFRSLDGIARGRALAEGDQAGRLDLDTLTDAQKTDLASYYDGLLRRRYGAGSGKGKPDPLSAEELNAYENLNRLFKRKAAASGVDAPANAPSVAGDAAPGNTAPVDPFLPDGNRGLGLDPNDLPSRTIPDDGFDPGAAAREVPRPEDPFLPEGNKSLGLDDPEPIPSRPGDTGESGTNASSPPDPFLPDGNRGLGLDPDDVPANTLPDSGFDPYGVTREMPRPSDPFLPDGNRGLGLDPEELPSSRLPDGDFDPNGVTREMPRPDDPFLPDGNRGLGLDPEELPSGRLPDGEFDPNGVTREMPRPEDSVLPDGSRGPSLESPEPVPGNSGPPVEVEPGPAGNPRDSLPPSDPGTVLIPEGTPPLPIPEKGTPTVIMPADAPPLPIPSSGNKGGPATKNQPDVSPIENAPAVPSSPKVSSPNEPVAPGGFGMSPGGGKPPRVRKANPLPQLERELSAANQNSLIPHQGRAAMDDMAEAQRKVLRQKRLSQLDEAEGHYGLENFNKRGTPEFEAGIEELRAEASKDLDAIDRAFARERTDLVRDHEVLDEVEAHLGTRTREDYGVLDVERARSDQVMTKEEGVLGTLYNRFTRKRGQPIQGAPEQHRAALEASGLSRDEMREMLQKWIDPTQSADPAAVQRAADRYLDWAGVKPSPPRPVEPITPGSIPSRTPEVDEVNTPTVILPAPDNSTVLIPEGTPPLPIPETSGSTVLIPEGTPPLPIPETGSPTVRMPEGTPPLPIPEAGNSTVLMPKDAEPLPIPASGDSPAPGRNSGTPNPGPADESVTIAPPASDGPVGGFGMTPGAPGGAPRPVRVDPEVQARENYRRTSGAANEPHQGRQKMDDLKEAEYQLSRQREIDDLEARLDNHRFDSSHPLGSPEYQAELEEVRRRWQDDLDSMERGFERRKQVFASDHEVMDEVEKHLGNRTQDDYFTLDLERRRPTRVLTKEEGVLGTLYNRSRSDRLPLRGTPEQHRAALEASGLNREQARGLLKQWVDPIDKANPADVDRVVENYLKWTGY